MLRLKIKNYCKKKKGFKINVDEMERRNLKRKKIEEEAFPDALLK